MSLVGSELVDIDQATTARKPVLDALVEFDDQRIAVGRGRPTRRSTSASRRNSVTRSIFLAHSAMLVQKTSAGAGRFPGIGPADSM